MKKILSVLLLLIILIQAASCSTGSSVTGTETVTEGVPRETETETAPVTETEPQTDAETELVFEPAEDPYAELHVPAVFGSHMVLQRDREYSVWGTSNRDGSVIRGTVGTESFLTSVSDGRWKLTFPPRQASTEPVSVLIEDEFGNKAAFDDVLFGEVWLLSGQSNAEVTLSQIYGAINKTEFDENEPIRFVMQSGVAALAEREKQKTPQSDLLSDSWGWKLPDEANCMGTSALAFFFARRLAAGTGVPVGVICTGAAGAVIQELMPEELASELGFKGGAVALQGGYYNTLMHPFVGLSVSGMIFFQGESEAQNSGSAKKYPDHVNGYFTGMRQLFGYDFPVYNVQLCSYTKKSEAQFGFVRNIRVSQYNAAKQIADCTLIPSFDLGPDEYYYDHMHSFKKDELARRIVSAVLFRQFNIGTENDSLPPEPVSAVLSEDGETVTVKFKNVGEGLRSTSYKETVAGFSVGTAGKQNTAEAEIISADTVLVHVPAGSKTAMLAYAFENNVTRNSAQLQSSGKIPPNAFMIGVE